MHYDTIYSYFATKRLYMYNQLRLRMDRSPHVG